jgi:transposase
MRLTGRQREPDRQAIGIDQRMNLAGQSTTWPPHRLPPVPCDAGTVLMHANNGRVYHLHGGIMGARLAGKLLSRLKSRTMLLADRGYDADWIRVLAAKKGAWANIPPRCNRSEPICFSPYLYRARNLVERFFNKIKHYRRVATRYDKLAANYLAFVQLASIRLWLRVNESAS